MAEQNKIISWLDERYPVNQLFDFMRKKQVPVHKFSFWYYMGGVALFLFIIQVCTGILLLLYYKPGEESSYESIRFLMNEVHFGWLIRSLHSWSANLMIFFVFVHMFSTFFTRAFKKPRELTWVSGFILLSLALTFGFSGYLLPWNELSYFATKVGTDIVGVVPGIGETLKVLLRGGEDVSGGTLVRFFAIHIAILPALFTAILLLHLLFVQIQGMHEPEEYTALPPEKKKTIPFFPNFALRDALLWLIVLNILLFLAVYFPWELGLKADPFAPAPQGIRPEWYFMFMFQTLKLLPSHILFIEGEQLGVIVFGIGAVLWMLVPFWVPARRKKMIKIIGVVIIVYILIMTILGYVL